MFKIVAIIAILISLLAWINIIGNTFGFPNFTDNFFNFIRCSDTCVWLVAFAGIILAVIFWWLGSER